MPIHKTRMEKLARAEQRAANEARRRIERKARRKARVPLLMRLLALIRSAWKAAIGTAAVFATLAGIWHQWLRVDLTVSPTPIDAGGDPFTASFEVKNGSAYDLLAVQAACMVNHVATRTLTAKQNMVAMGTAPVPETLSARGGSKTISCPINFDNRRMGPRASAIGFPDDWKVAGLTSADVEIVVSYAAPWWVPYAGQSKRVRYVGRRTPAGWRWETQPLIDDAKTER